MGILRTLFFILVVYYLFRFINRVIVPFFRAVTEMNERQKQNSESPVTTHSSAKRTKSTEGDYVDYKEIKD
ncbi:MAG: hypothetical protein MH137_13590 [Flavobacteriales bacterium]|nr:hypothetical protein [Flavobacteriales bacterium]